MSNRTRRGMAEQMDVAHPADVSLLDRFPLRKEDGEIRAEFVEEITRRIQAKDTQFLRAVVAELHEADLGDLIAAVEPQDRVSLVEMTGTDFDFSALNEVDDAVREEILEELEPETVAEGVRELESDDAVELLEALDEEDQEEILEKLPPSERVALERRLLYPENSAGRRMQTEFITVPPEWTVGRAIDYMRDTPDLPERFYEIYAVDAAKHWQGAVPLDVLLRSRRPVPLAELIDEDRRRVSVLDDQEEVARMFGKYNLVAAPVIDTQNRLVGIITIDDVVDVIEEEADEDLKALGGVTRFKIPGLDVVIGLAIICNLVAGALGGILIPMVLERVRADPAVASGTFVTTITDVVGFFSFLGIATLWFGLK